MPQGFQPPGAEAAHARGPAEPPPLPAPGRHRRQPPPWPKARRGGGGTCGPQPGRERRWAGTRSRPSSSSAVQSGGRHSLTRPPRRKGLGRRKCRWRGGAVAALLPGAWVASGWGSSGLPVSAGGAFGRAVPGRLQHVPGHWSIFLSPCRLRGPLPASSSVTARRRRRVWCPRQRAGKIGESCQSLFKVFRGFFCLFACLSAWDR